MLILALVRAGETLATTAVTRATVVAVSFDPARGGCAVRAYQRDDGRLRWDELVEISPGSESLTMRLSAVSVRTVGPDASSADHRVLVACGTSAAVLNLATGDSLWQLDFDESDGASDAADGLSGNKAAGDGEGVWVAVASDASPVEPLSRTSVGAAASSTAFLIALAQVRGASSAEPQLDLRAISIDLAEQRV